MKAAKLILGLISLGLAFIIPLYFEQILFSLVGSIGLGWVMSTILLRLLVIILFAIFLKQVFNLFEITRKIKSYLVFIIALLPGFGISFIYPIYQLDYGMYNDGFQMENSQEFNKAVGEDVIIDGEKSLVVFFTTTCPHCMYACRKLSINREAGQNLQVNAIFPGNKNDTEEFLSNHNGLEFNWFLIDDSTFIKYSGGAFPSIFLMDEKGETEYHWTGDELNYSALDYLLGLD